MKILHVINNLGSGGAESMLLNFIREAQDKDYHFEILLLVDNIISYKEVHENIKINLLDNSHKRFSFKKLIKLYNFIKNNKFDIIHSHLFPTQYYIALVKLMFFGKLKIVTTEHNTTNTRRKYKITRLLDYLIYSIYDEIVFISEGVKEQFRKDFVKIKKGIVIKNGIPLKKFSPLKEKKEKKKIVKIIMVARFSRQKDHLTLLKAMLLLNEKYELSLVGEGENKKELISFVINNKLEERVHFLGFRNDIDKLYQTHDIFVLSSYWEGFGLVVVEAMASGLPVVVSNVVGVRDVVKGAGLLFEPENEMDLVKKIKLLVENKKLYNELVQKGLQKSREYDIINLVTKTKQLYENLLENRK